jgi:nicotinamide-nucleotide amidase
MADHPQGAETLPNRNGVALGIAMEHRGTWLFAMPGVPSEMTAMLDEQVLPRLRIASGEPAILRSRLLRTWGQGESQIAEALDDLYTSTNPSLAFLVSGAEVRVRISAKAADAATADTMIAAVEHEVARRLGTVVYGRDDDTVETIAVRELGARGWRIGTVEVATLGSVAATLASADHDRVAFAGGLTMPPVAVDDHTDLAQRAERLLEQGRSTLDGDVLVAVSESHGDQPGPRSTQTLVVAVATPEQARTRAVGLLGDHARVREYAHDTALHLVRLAVTGQWWDA